jgi:hypothetical protein
MQYVWGREPYELALLPRWLVDRIVRVPDDVYDDDLDLYDHDDDEARDPGVLLDRRIRIVRLGTERRGCSELLRLHRHPGRGRPSGELLQRGR